MVFASWAYPDAVGAALAARLLEKKLFVMVLGSDINLAHHYGGRVAQIRWALSRAGKIVAVSGPLKEKLVAMGVPADKITVVTNGVDKTKFNRRDQNECRRALQLPSDRKLILYVGNLVPVKGVQNLVRAVALLTRVDVELLIVGDGPLKADLKKLGEELKVGDRVSFRGRRPHEEIPLYMSACDVFCLPSLNEGCPNVVLEAMACGAKVVASRVGGIPDLIDSPHKGWLAEAGNPEDLARCLREALGSESAQGPIDIMSWEENAKRVMWSFQGENG